MAEGTRFRAMLLGGPFDGQDVLMSHRQLSCGVYSHGGHRYVAAKHTAQCAWPVFRCQPAVEVAEPDDEYDSTSHAARGRLTSEAY